MAWVIRQLNISKDLGLTEDGITVSITPIVWLPEAVMISLMRKATRLIFLQSKLSAFGDVNLDLSEEEQKLSEDEQNELLATRADSQFAVIEDALKQMRPIMIDILKEVVVDWTIKDEKGVVLPSPSVLVEQSREGEIDKLPLQLKMHILMAAQSEAEAEVPLVNVRQSEDSSTAVNGTSKEPELSIVSNS
jgi:adenylate kinase